MPKPDPYAESERIREDLYILLTKCSAKVSRTTDPKALKSLQSSLVRWIQRNTEEEAP